MLRKLSREEIEKYASRKGVRRIAVENFLMTNDNNADVSTALANLDMDIRLYHWNSATASAIRDGILQSTLDENMICPKCFGLMKMEKGFRCSGLVCPKCGHSEMDNDYY